MQEGSEKERRSLGVAGDRVVGCWIGQTGQVTMRTTPRDAKSRAETGKACRRLDRSGTINLEEELADGIVFVQLLSAQRHHAFDW
jgi:hypothetical protein